MIDHGRAIESQVGDDLLASLAEEFLQRVRAGEQPSADEYASKHPELASRIRELFPAVLALEQPALGRTQEFGPLAERVGATIGRYKLLERIGEGGFGVVFMAEQQHPVRRKVALKIIKPGMDTRQVLARFDAERQALAIMDHPNIAKVFDGGMTDSGRPYFVMELVKGEPITTFCDRNQLSPRQRLELFAEVCNAVQHAHTKGIIHRDIKPTNVLVAMNDTTPAVKMIDFGVAKALGQELTDKTLFTGFAQLLGTPLYMSPEQAGQSSLDVDTRSDIYSLGVLLYELLTGTTPFDKERFQQAAHDEIRRIIREEEPPTPSTRLNESNDSLPSVASQRRMEPAKLTKLVRGELDWIVMKALEKDRTRRYETANAFAADVERYLADEPVLACPPSVGYRLRKFARRNKATLATASVVGLALLFAVGSFGWAVRDRTARHAKVTGQVELILAEVDQLQREQKWPEALSAVRRAEAAVASDDADVAIAQRVRQLLQDLDLVDRLEQIRMMPTDANEELKFADVDREYAQAFRDHGVDIDKLRTETSIDRLKTRPKLAVPLAAALDQWALGRRGASDGDAAGWTRLVTIARGIDPEPLRDQLRSTWGQPMAETRDELRQMADSIDFAAQNPATLVCWALTLRQAELPDSARQILREAQYAYPGDYWINFKLAEELFAKEDFEGAIRFYTAAVSLRPYSADASFNLGFTINRLNRTEEAIAAYRRTVAIEPSNYAASINVAINLGAQQKLDEAVATFHKAIDAHPNRYQPRLYFGQFLRRQGKTADADAEFESAIDIAREVADREPTSQNYLALGDVLRDSKKKEDVDDAVVAYHRAVELDPKNSYAYGHLATALRTQEKWDDAIDAYYKAVEADPITANEYRRLLGQALFERGKIAEANEVTSKAVEVDPRDHKSHILRASTNGALGEWEAAAADYEKLMQITPKDQWAWYFRACTLAYLKRNEEYSDHCRAMLAEFDQTQDLGIIERTTKTALLLPDGLGVGMDEVNRRVERVCERDWGSPWVLLLRGMAECRAGRYQEAAELLERCRAVPPDDYFAQVAFVPANAYLAIARYRLGEMDQARAALERASAQERVSFPPVGRGDWSKVGIDHWLLAQIALREARELIKTPQATSASKP